MKTHTLTGADLNRAVAMALGKKVQQRDIPTDGACGRRPARRWAWEVNPGYWIEIPNYAGDIAAAWPIMKKHKIGLEYGVGLNGKHWRAGRAVQCYALPSSRCAQDDLDPQIAAMRCFVASVYGDEINLET